MKTLTDLNVEFGEAMRAELERLLIGLTRRQRRLFDEAYPDTVPDLELTRAIRVCEKTVLYNHARRGIR